MNITGANWDTVTVDESYSSASGAVLPDNAKTPIKTPQQQQSTITTTSATEAH
jgi:hypothetical protein